MARTLTIRIDDRIYMAFLKRAKAENRALANFIETAVAAHIRDSAFVDDKEMAEILSNERLIERLRRGSKDAGGKKGTLIGLVSHL